MDDDDRIRALSRALLDFHHDGVIELATARNAEALAPALLYFLQTQPDDSVVDWLVDRDEVSEVYAEDDALKEQLARALSGALPPVRPASPPRHPELEARILADPDDVTAHLVLGDWLGERGDPRGALIALHARMLESPNPRDPGLRAREEALVNANRQAWLGGLRHDDDVELTWHLGFLRAARFSWEVDGEPVDFDGLMRDLAALPYVEFIRALTFDGMPSEDYEPRWDDLVRALVTHCPPPHLRELTLDRGHWDISSTSVGDLTPLYPRLAHLETLRLELGHMNLGEMQIPSLRKLVIVTGGLTAENLRSIASGTWPRLEELALCLGSSTGDYGCDVQVEDLQPLFDGSAFPALRKLGIKNSSLADEIARQITVARVLPRLEELDLSLGTLSDPGARALLDRAERLLHLRAIVIGHHWISPALTQELEAVFGDRVKIDRGLGSGYRYVQISE